MIAPIAEMVGQDIHRLPQPSSVSFLKAPAVDAKRSVDRLPRRVRGSLTRLRTASVHPAPNLPAGFEYEMALLHSRRARLPTTKAERVLGFSPPVSFAEGCRRSVEWLRTEGLGA